MIQYDDLSQEQQGVIDSVTLGKNVFITGGAGTGKSFLLQYLKEQFPKMNICASTGIAAVQVGGVTLHSWAGLGLGVDSADKLIAKISNNMKVRPRLESAEILAIDEISMISPDLFDKLNEILKAIREDQRPFGGLQLVLFGDFLQLPPVYREAVPEKEFCFESDAWSEADFQCFMLKKIFRQSDEKFINLLNDIRFGTISEEDIRLLEEATRPPEKEGELKPTKICTHNYQADKVNSKELADLEGKKHEFKAFERGVPQLIEYIKKNCLAPMLLTLKKGAQVMMLRNTLQDIGIVNGSTGIVKKFSDEGLPIVEFTNGVQTKIKHDEWKIESYDPSSGKKETKACIKQIPLRLAWAITVHKSQGMTLDKVECDLASAFAEGQVYVALSRARSLDGLFIKSIKPDMIRVNSKVVNFMKSI